MLRRMNVRVLSFVALSAALFGCGVPCGGEAERIAALTSGETLALDPACVISEPVTIPAGARVTGGTFVMDAGERIVVTSSGDTSMPTTLEGAHVSGGSGTYTIGVMGTGAAHIGRTTLVLERGAGIVAFGATVTIDDVHLTGNVDPSALISLPSGPPGDRFATFAIVAEDGATVTITGSDASRFARAGVWCNGSTLVATGTEVNETVEAPILLVDCDATLDDVEVSGTLAAIGRPGMAIASLASSVEATDLFLHDAPGYGVYAVGSELTFHTPRVERIEQGGIWAATGTTLELDGGTFSDNEGAAIAAVGAEVLTVRDATITGTVEAPIPTLSGMGVDRMADGIHVAEGSAPMTVTLERVMLVGNERIGLVLDGGGAMLATSITDVTVMAPDTALGAVAQNVTALPVTWDDGITRDGSAARDAVAPSLEVSDGTPYGILMPPTLSP